MPAEVYFAQSGKVCIFAFESLTNNHIKTMKKSILLSLFLTLMVYSWNYIITTNTDENEKVILFSYLCFIISIIMLHCRNDQLACTWEKRKLYWNAIEQIIFYMKKLSYIFYCIFLLSTIYSCTYDTDTEYRHYHIQFKNNTETTIWIDRSRYYPDTAIALYTRDPRVEKNSAVSPL